MYYPFYIILVCTGNTDPEFSILTEKNGILKHTAHLLLSIWCITFQIQHYSYVLVMYTRSDHFWSSSSHKIITEKSFPFHESRGEKRWKERETWTENKQDPRENIAKRPTDSTHQRPRWDKNQFSMTHSSSWLVSPDWVCIPLADWPPKG